MEIISFRYPWWVQFELTAWAPIFFTRRSLGIYLKKKNYNETNSFVLQTSWTLYYAFRSWKLQTYLVKHSFSNFETHVDNQGETMCMFLINLYLTHHNAVFWEPFDVQDPLWAFQIWLLSIFPLNQKATFFFSWSKWNSSLKGLVWFKKFSDSHNLTKHVLLLKWIILCSKQ